MTCEECHKNLRDKSGEIYVSGGKPYCAHCYKGAERIVQSPGSTYDFDDEETFHSLLEVNVNFFRLFLVRNEEHLKLWDHVERVLRWILSLAKK